MSLRCVIVFVVFEFSTVKPFIIRGPYDQKVVEGSSVTFQCRVGGEPVPDILWRRTAAAGNMPLGMENLFQNFTL